MSRRPNRPAHTDQLPARLDRNQPKGQQLLASLETLVADLEPGTLLPSERVLAEEYGVARMTVRQQIDALVQAGKAVRVLGSGTFSAQPPPDRRDGWTSLWSEIRDRGQVPSSDVLALDRSPAPPGVAAGLGISDGALCIRLVRARRRDGELICYQVTHLRPGLGSALDAKALESDSLQRMLARQDCVEVAADRRRYRLETLECEPAQVLELDAGRPVLVGIGTTLEVDGTPVSYAESVFLPSVEIEVTVRAPASALA